MKEYFYAANLVKNRSIQLLTQSLIFSEPGESRFRRYSWDFNQFIPRDQISFRKGFSLRTEPAQVNIEN